MLQNKTAALVPGLMSRSISHWTMVLSMIIAVACVATLAGCQDTIKVSDKDLTQITYRQFDELIKQSKPEELVIVDIRKAENFNAGHIPGSINIFLPELTAYEPRLGKATHIVVYGRGWHDALSRAAGKRLLAMGYKGVQDFQGGLESWQSEGRLVAVIRDTDKPAKPADSAAQPAVTP